MILVLGGKNPPEVLIDDEDAWITQWKWYLCGKVYIRRKGIPCVLPRVLLDMGPKQDNINVPIHLNGNHFDNRRCNLKIVTPSVAGMRQSKRNTTTGYYGVTYITMYKKYFAYVQWRNKGVYAGKAETALEAAHMRDKKMFELYGEDGVYNFPENFIKLKTPLL